MASSSNTSSNPSSARPLRWLQRVRNNKILIRCGTYTYFLDVGEIRCCLDFDTQLRKPGVVLTRLDIPVAYSFFAERVNSDPLIEGKLAVFNLEAGTIYAPMPTINRDIFATFTRGGNSQSVILRTLGLSDVRSEKQPLFSQLLLRSAERGATIRDRNTNNSTPETNPILSFGSIPNASLSNLDIHPIPMSSTSTMPNSVQNSGSMPGKFTPAEESQLNAMIQSLSDPKITDDFGFYPAPPPIPDDPKGPANVGDSDVSMKNT